MSKDPAENAGSLSDEPKFEDVIIDIAEGEDQEIEVVEDAPKSPDAGKVTGDAEVKAEPVVDVRKQPEYDPVADLRSQLEASNRRAEEERKGRETERQAREEAESYALRAGREAEAAKGAKIQSDLHSVINAISAEKAESESAKRALVDASASGDHVASAEAQQAMARAEARLITLQDGQSQLERMVEQQKARVESEGKRRPVSDAKPKTKAEPAKAEPQRGESTGDPAEDYIRGRTPRTAEFLRKNDRGWLTNQKSFHRLQAAHSMALSEGYTQESDAYFEFINGRMSEPAPVVEKKAETPVPAARKPQVSAPPSRDSAVPSARSSTQIHLNSDQLSMAKSLGMTPLAYAKKVKEARDNAKTGAGPRFSVDST